MNGVRMGALLIPIVETYTSGNGPNGALPYQIPTNEQPTITSQMAQSYFERSKEVYNGSAHTDALYHHTASETPGSLAGRIDLSGGAVIDINTFEYNTNSNPTKGGVWRADIKTNNVVDYNIQASYGSSIGNWPPVNSTYFKETRMCAIRITYITNPGYFNYLIVITTRSAAVGASPSQEFTITPSWGLNMKYWQDQGINAHLTEEEIPDVMDPSDPHDYEPDPDDTCDLISLPNSPAIGVTDIGFINVYNPSTGSLQGLGDILFPNVASATDIVDAVIKLCETLANQNLINYVIDCHVIPVTPTTGANENIKVGYRNTGIASAKVTSDYVDVSCGSLNIREYFSSFADYLYTRSKLYLPFVGFVDMKPEYWQSGTISVDYKFNVIDGSFMAYVRSVSSKSNLNGSVIAQYSGNACMHFPITGVNYSNMVSGIVGAAVGVATGGAGAAAVLGEAASAANTFLQGGDVQQSNGYNATSGLLGVRVPYLIIERPVASYPAGYAHNNGYPSNIGTSLGSITGYTEVDNIDLTGIPLTQAELEELRGLLKEGVYF